MLPRAAKTQMMPNSVPYKGKGETVGCAAAAGLELMIIPMKNPKAIAHTMKPAMLETAVQQKTMISAHMLAIIASGCAPVRGAISEGRRRPSKDPALRIAAM